MTAGLPELFSRDPLSTDALDLFVGTCLTDGGIWDRPRMSDGISNIDRVFERGSDGIGVCARIWEIDDQSVHTFWLEVKRDAVNARIAWSLYFDVIEISPRRARDAVHNYDRAEDIEWLATLTGEATVIDGVLTIVEGSTRALVRDMPAQEAPPNEERRRRRTR